MIKYDVPLNLGENANMHLLVEKIKPNSRVLEFGPATGRLTRYMKEELECEVYIVEIDSEAYQISQNYAKHGICGDIEDYQWIEMIQGVEFDYIIFADVLEHLRNPKKVIDTVKSYLKQTGSILVSIPNITHNAVILQLLNNRFDYKKTGLLDNTHIHFFTKDTCREMFESCGYYMAECNGTFAEPYNTELKMSFEGLPKSVEHYLASRDYSNLYQIIFEFTLVDRGMNDNLEKNKQRDFFCKMFFDYGDGFSEENSKLIKLDMKKQVQDIHITFEDKMYIKRVAFSPLDNFWSKSKIICFESNLGEVTNYTLDDYTIKNSDLYNIMSNQKYAWSIEEEVLYIQLKFESVLLLEDVVLKEYNKRVLTLNYEISINEQNTKDIIQKKELYIKDIMAKSEHYVDFLNNSNQQLVDSIFNGFDKISKLGIPQKRSFFNRIINKVETSPRFNIKIYDYENYQPFELYKNNCVFSSVENPDAVFTADYAILKFNKSQIRDIYYEKITQYCGQEIALYTDSFLISNNEPYFKTDFSADFVFNNDCEFDVVMVHTEILNLINKNYGLSNFTNSRDFIIALSSITDRIYHLPIIGYDSNMIPERVTNESNVILKNTLFQKYKYHANVKNGLIRYDYIENEPKVTIIIPTKDKIELLKDCLESIVNKSTYKNYEVLILDNRSELEETFEWFEILKNKYVNVRIEKADFEFNWSKLNNYGIHKSVDSEVFIFLNNDTLVKSADWIERLAENALRPDVGVVGALLLYADDTIQHAGVVVGMTDFADHIYKGEKADFKSSVFASPSSKRNLLAVTGACMAISRDTINKIGGFNEEFIICGSDVEICIRAYNKKLVNVYEPSSVLYHLESKSRDSYIPEIDFVMSQKHYEPYRSKGDPFFNSNLNYKKTTPKGEGKSEYKN